jgi:type II secretory pathway component GspD/PulD (secretin)
MRDIRRKLLAICGGAICLVLGSVVGFGAEPGSQSPPTPDGSTTKTANLEVRSSDDQLEIIITGNSLPEVLRDIAKISGITFDVSPRVTEEVTVNMVMANNWQEVMHKLLQHANWVGILGKDGTLKQVIVLGQSESSAAPARRRVRVPSTRSKARSSRD